jgi:hypothetical protein
MISEVGTLARTPKWFFAAYHVIAPAVDDVDVFFEKVLRELPIQELDGFEWGFSDIEDATHDGDRYVFGYLYKSKPHSDRPRIDKDARKTRTEPLEDELVARAAFFIRPDQHVLAFHPQGEVISPSRFGDLLKRFVEGSTDIGFVSFYFNLISETENIFKAIRTFHRVESLDIRLVRPNPRLTPRWRRIKEEIDQIRAHEYRQQFRAKKEGALDIGDDTWAHRSIEMAADGFGEARLVGIGEDGARATASTKEHPATVDAPDAEPGKRESVLGILAAKFHSILSRGGSDESQNPPV